MDGSGNLQIGIVYWFNIPPENDEDHERDYWQDHGDWAAN